MSTDGSTEGRADAAKVIRITDDDQIATNNRADYDRCIDDVGRSSKRTRAASSARTKGSLASGGTQSVPLPGVGVVLSSNWSVIREN